MTITFPYMGTFTYTMNAILNEMGREDYIIPTEPSNKTKELGSQHAPEFICTPFKMLLGSLIETVEKGADEIVEPGFVGYCRFGLYFPVHKIILEDLGYDVTFISPDYDKPLDILKSIKELGNDLNYIQAIRALQVGWIKNRYIDYVDNALNSLRALEVTKGTTKKIAKEAYEIIIETRGMSNIRKLRKIIPKMFNDGVEINSDIKPLKVGLVGELYAVLEPAINLDIFKRLNELKVIAHTPITFSRWIDVGLKLNPFKRPHHKIARRKAKPYIRYRLGGETQESLGSAIMFKDEGWDGMIHLYPLTCMPEIITRSILPHISKKFNFPILSLVLDEHTGEAGLQSRLEAFIDLLDRKRKNVQK